MSDASPGNWGSDADDLEPRPEPLPEVHVKPTVLTWLTVFYALNVVLCALLLAGGILTVKSDPEALGDEEDALILGVIAVMMAVMLIGSLFGCFVPRRPWARNAHLVLLCALTLCFNCLVILTGPLIYFLFKPEVAGWYATQSAS